MGVLSGGLLLQGFTSRLKEVFKFIFTAGRESGQGLASLGQGRARAGPVGVEVRLQGQVQLLPLLAVGPEGSLRASVWFLVCKTGKERHTDGEPSACLVHVTCSESRDSNAHDESSVISIN